MQEKALLPPPQPNFNFRVDNTVNLPYFKSFTHKSLNNPPSTSDFINTYSFFWNSTDKVTIFKFIGTQDDSEHKNIICVPKVKKRKL